MPFPLGKAVEREGFPVAAGRRTDVTAIILEYAHKAC